MAAEQCASSFQLCDQTAEAAAWAEMAQAFSGTWRWRLLGGVWCVWCVWCVCVCVCVAFSGTPQLPGGIQPLTGRERSTVWTRHHM